jgi:hypothetical protein
MKIRFLPVLLLVSSLAAVATLAAPADQHPYVHLDRDAIVGGTVVPAGTYRLEVAPGQKMAKFLQGKRTVAEAPCTVALANVVYAGTAVHYRNGNDGHDALVKIVFSSSNLAVEF